MKKKNAVCFRSGICFELREKPELEDYGIITVTKTETDGLLEVL